MQIIVFPPKQPSATPTWFDPTTYDGPSNAEWKKWHILGLFLVSGPFPTPVDMSGLTGAPATYGMAASTHSCLHQNYGILCRFDGEHTRSTIATNRHGWLRRKSDRVIVRKRDTRPTTSIARHDARPACIQMYVVNLSIHVHAYTHVHTQVPRRPVQKLWG
jgi:hypothetical protein